MKTVTYSTQKRVRPTSLQVIFDIDKVRFHPELHLGQISPRISTFGNEDKKNWFHGYKRSRWTLFEVYKS